MLLQDVRQHVCNDTRSLSILHITSNSVKLTLINIAISVSHNSSAFRSLFSHRKCLTFERTKEETESELGEGYHPSFHVPYRNKMPLRSISVL